MLNSIGDFQQNAYSNDGEFLANPENNTYIPKLAEDFGYCVKKSSKAVRSGPGFELMRRLLSWRPNG
jgi:hypothetical protein